MSEHIWIFYLYDYYINLLMFQMQNTVITVMNVYNLRENNHRIQTWKKIVKTLNIIQEKIIFLSNFNAHHSI